MKPIFAIYFFHAHLFVHFTLLILTTTFSVTTSSHKECLDGRNLYPYCMMDKQGVLYCDYSNYTQIPSAHSLMERNLDCKRAKSLQINKSCLQKILQADLEPFPLIEEFNGNDNFLTEIPHATFIKNSKLKEIHLCNNKIRQVQYKAFPDGLLHLHLRSNHINDLDDLFMPSFVETINIDFNEITIIKQRHFMHLANMKELSLRGNRIKYIRDHAFAGNHNLTHLHLDGNKMTHVTELAFQGLHDLEVLTISHNRIQVWPEQYGELFKNVHTMNLGHNDISQFMGAHLADMSKLRNFSIENNSLTEIPETLFNSTSQLVFLNLSSNYFTEVSPHMFSNLWYIE